jgi:putative membrane protein
MRNYLRPIAICAITGAGLLLSTALAQDPPKPQDPTKTQDPTKAQDPNSADRMTTGDSTFATKAAAGGLAEIQFGNLAADHAASPDVKAFGQQMVADHTKVCEQLKQIASGKGIALPTAMEAKDQATYDTLAKLNGADFDRAYMQSMVTDHKTDVKDFKTESEKGTDGELKAFASSTLPTLEQHLQLAQSTEAKVKSGK